MNEWKALWEINQSITRRAGVSHTFVLLRFHDILLCRSYLLRQLLFIQASFPTEF